MDLLKDHNLPGADLVASGIEALERGEHTIEALAVAVARPRLRDLGLKIPEAADAIEEPNMALYAPVCTAGGGPSQYDAISQRPVNFARAAAFVRHPPDSSGS